MAGSSGGRSHTVTKRPFASRWQQPWFGTLVTVARRLLRPLGNLENRLIERLVADQNQQVWRYLATHPPQKVLLILPRCVKKTGCHVDVQTSVSECLSCLQCPVGDAAALCQRHGLRALVAFRSHIAFDMARREQPDVIIASACHDRMIKALRSVPEYPALLAPLAGMDRMCVNATLDLEWLESQLELVAPTAPSAQAAAGP